LSYETKTTFTGAARPTDARTSTHDDNMKSNGGSKIGDGSDRLYWPVDDDDI
jgi:hypothetical protein